MGVKAGSRTFTKLGARLRRAREAKGLTLRQAESLTGISNATISQIETGHVRMPSFQFVMRLCKVYEIKAEDLV